MISTICGLLCRKRKYSPLPVAVFLRQVDGWTMPAGNDRAKAWAKVKGLPNYHRDRLAVVKANRAALHMDLPNGL